MVLSLTQYSHPCSIHYHRIHPVYWKDRLQRVQAMGLNTIEVRHAADSASRHEMPMPYQMLRTLQNIRQIVMHDFLPTSYVMVDALCDTASSDFTVRLQLYTPWNFHERTPGKFTFEGEADVERFLDIAQDLGLNVLLRVGPYICGEWDFGGFPWWLASSKVRPVQCSPHQTELDASHLEDVALDLLLCQKTLCLQQTRL